MLCPMRLRIFWFVGQHININAPVEGSSGLRSRPDSLTDDPTFLGYEIHLNAAGLRQRYLLRAKSNKDSLNFRGGVGA